MTMVQCYTEAAQKKADALELELVTYIRTYFVRTQNPGSPSYWLNFATAKEDINFATPEEIAVHQAKVRNLRQQIENTRQKSILIGFETSGMTAVEAEYKKVAPLVWRRENQLLVAQILNGADWKKGLDDGEPFSFNEPVDVPVTTMYCGCGQYPRELINKMSDEEHKAASEHLQLCQHPIEEHTTEKSQVSKHQVADWNCRACYRSPGKSGDQMVALSGVEWCPRFLRPFREMPPFDYKQQIKDDSSCYAGLLHRQISVVAEEDGRQFLIKEERCDTCDYNTYDRSEIKLNTEIKTEETTSNEASEDKQT